MVFPVTEGTAFKIVTFRNQQTDVSDIRDTAIQALCRYCVRTGSKSTEACCRIIDIRTAIDTEPEASGGRGYNNGTCKAFTIRLNRCHYRSCRLIKGLRHIKLYWS